MKLKQRDSDAISLYLGVGVVSSGVSDRNVHTALKVLNRGD